jgi:hypothetical protein
MGDITIVGPHPQYTIFKVVIPLHIGRYIYEVSDQHSDSERGWGLLEGSPSYFNG